MDYTRAKELWDKRVKGNDFRRIPHCRDTIKEGPDGSLKVYGWGEDQALLFFPDGRIRVVGGNSGWQPTTMFFNRQLPHGMWLRYIRGYKHGRYFLRHIKADVLVPFVDGLEFTEGGIISSQVATPVKNPPNIQAPPDLRAVGRKIKQAWRIQLLSRTKLGLYDEVTGRSYGPRRAEVLLNRGGWLEADMAALAASYTVEYVWESGGVRTEVPLYDRVKKGFEHMWKLHKKEIYEYIRDGKLTLDLFV